MVCPAYNGTEPVWIKAFVYGIILIAYMGAYMVSTGIMGAG